MSEWDSQPILRCTQCNKPFDKYSTLKRHGYYCRSRQVGNTIRPRSCIACARAKTRCDQKQPECRRCTAKTLECHYPVTRLGAHNRTSIETRNGTPRSVSSDTRTGKRAEDTNPSWNASADGVLNGPKANLYDVEGIDMDWSGQYIDFSAMLDPDTKGLQSPSATWLPPSGPSTIFSDQTLQEFSTMFPPQVSIPRPPTNFVRSIGHRPMAGGMGRIAKLMIHTLNSYSVMMLRDNTLPPFIHPALTSPGSEVANMEPLMNCISLVRMLSNNVPGSRKLFWKNVRQECERLCIEHPNSDTSGNLAALQALSIYLLLRLNEGENDDNNLDYLLLSTFSIIAQHMSRLEIQSNTQSAQRSEDPDSRWKLWVLNESRHRLAIVFRIVNMLLFFEPAKLCTLQADLVFAPLPAKKQIWEARSVFEWEAELKKDGSVQTQFGLTSTGDLVQLDDGQSYCNPCVFLRYRPLDIDNSPQSTNNWEKWCAGMDGFGGLVMLAASLIE